MNADPASTDVDAADLARLRAAERRRVRRRAQRAANPTARGPEVVSMLGRMLPTLADHVEFIEPEQVRALRTLLADAELEVIRRLRARGEPWSYVGRALGITAQAAQQRWARAQPTHTTEGTTAP